MARQPFNTRWAQGVESQSNANTFQTPPGPRLSSGWEGGQDKDAPPAGQENWWHNRVDSALQDLERKGAMAWHSGAIYGIGAPCYATDGYFYESLTAGNSNNSPLSSSIHWRQIGQSLYSTFSIAEYKDVAHNGSPETGWLKCTGAVLLRAAYPKLFAAIGTTYNVGGELSTQFRLPDWRGAFPRCLDDGRGIDSGRGLGNSLQASQNLSHSHGASSGADGVHNHAAESYAAGTHSHTAESYGAGYHAHSASSDAQGAHAHNVPGSIASSGGSVSFDGNPGGAAFNIATDTQGSHAHNITVNPVGDHVHGIGIYNAGNHAHGVGIFNSAAHAHAVYIAASGGTEARSINLAQVRWIRYL